MRQVGQRLQRALSTAKAASQQQGDWSGMATLYASNRATFQDAYAAECWEKVSNRSRVAEVVKQSNSVLDLGCGTGDYTIELASRFPRAVGVDISENMIAHARKISPDIRFEVADLSTDSAIFPNDEFDIIFSTMALHWPGPNPEMLAALFRILKPGGVFLAGFHGANSCQEGVDAIEKVATLSKNWKHFVLDDLPTMFKRLPSDAWHSALSDAGFVHLDLAERTVITEYFSHADCTKRLCAAWPPILSPAYLESHEISDFMELAATAMIDTYHNKHAASSSSSSGALSIDQASSKNDSGIMAIMTSHLIEFSAHKPIST